MPLYHFKFMRNGEASPRTDGLELADPATAWEEATTAFGEMIRSVDGDLKPGSDWHMDVTDAAGNMVYRLRFVTESFV